jgi:hypothetical protein
VKFDQLTPCHPKVGYFSLKKSLVAKDLLRYIVTKTLASAKFTQPLLISFGLGSYFLVLGMVLDIVNLLIILLSLTVTFFIITINTKWPLPSFTAKNELP